MTDIIPIIISSVTGLLGAGIGAFISWKVAKISAENVTKLEEQKYALEKKMGLYEEAIGAINQILSGPGVSEALLFFKSCEAKFILYGSSEAFRLYREAYYTFYPRLITLDFYADSPAYRRSPLSSEEYIQTQKKFELFLTQIKKELKINP